MGETGIDRVEESRPEASWLSTSLGRWITGSVALVGLVVAVLLWRAPDLDTGLLWSIRWTARLAFPLFWCAWVASSLDTVFGAAWTRALLGRRRELGISFAVVHLIHLAVIGIRAVHSQGESLAGRTWIELGGVVAYVFVVGMMATSFPAFSKLLSPSGWKRFHSLGGYWIAAVFLVSYGGRAVNDPAFLPQTLMLIGGFLLKGATARRRA